MTRPYDTFRQWVGYWVTRRWFLHNENWRECSLCRKWKEWKDFAAKRSPYEINGRTTACHECVKKKKKECEKRWDKKPAIKSKRRDRHYLQYFPIGCVFIWKNIQYTVLEHRNAWVLIESKDGKRQIVYAKNLHESVRVNAMREI